MPTRRTFFSVLAGLGALVLGKKSNAVEAGPNMEIDVVQEEPIKKADVEVYTKHPPVYQFTSPKLEINGKLYPITTIMYYQDLSVEVIGDCSDVSLEENGLISEPVFFVFKNDRIPLSATIHTVQTEIGKETSRLFCSVKDSRNKDTGQKNLTFSTGMYPSTFKMEVRGSLMSIESEINVVNAPDIPEKIEINLFGVMVDEVRPHKITKRYGLKAPSLGKQKAYCTRTEIFLKNWFNVN